MEELTTPGGAIALAIAALLLVFGFRLARPARAREWVAVAAYAVALAVQLLGARGLLPGPTLAAGPALRIGGTLLLVAGLLLAGKPSRSRRRAAMGAPTQPDRDVPGTTPVWAGLAMVVVGQLARGPSLAGAVATAIAVAANGWVALTPERR